MFDFIFVTAFKNIVSALKATFWIVRGIGRLVSAVLNRRQGGIG